MPKITREYLDKIKKDGSIQKNVVRVGMSTCGIAAGAEEIYRALKHEISRRDLPVTLKKCGCTGKCYAEPLVEVICENMPAVTYGKVTAELASEIVERHLVRGELINNHIYNVKTKKTAGGA